MSLPFGKTKERTKTFKACCQGTEGSLWRRYLYHGRRKSLEAVVVELSKNQDLTLTTVESCTGGASAARIINYARRF